MKFSQVIDRILSSDPLFRVSGVVDVQTLFTHEGEYGAYARLNGSRDGQSCTRFVGAVFGDEFTCVVDGFVLLREAQDTIKNAVHELLLGMQLNLGARRRRFFYEPPPRWRAIPSGLVANWYPPDYPFNRANLVVAAAEPYPGSVDGALDVASLLASERAKGFDLEGEPDEQNVISLVGITGRRCAVALRHVQRDERKRMEVAAFVVAPYLYALRFESMVPALADEQHKLFLDVVRSVAPLPAVGSGRIGVNTLTGGDFSHWAD